MDVEEVLHSAIRQSETGHRVGLLRDGRLRSIDAYAGAWQVEQARIIDSLWCGYDGISTADIHLQGDANVPQSCHQGHTHAPVLLPPNHR